MIYNFLKGLSYEAEKWNRGISFSRSYFVPFSSKELCVSCDPCKEVAASDRVFSLKGDWNYVRDESGSDTFDSSTAAWGRIAVPSLVKVEEKVDFSFLTKSKKKNKKSIVKDIYRTFFSVYDASDFHHIHFTRVSGAFEAYVNGVFCGSSLTGEGEFDCSTMVKEGENELLVVVREYSRADLFFAGKTKYFGITGDVLLSSHPSASLIDYAFDCTAENLSYAGKLSLAFIGSGDFSAKVTLCDRGKVLSEQELVGNEQTAEFRDAFVPYTPNDPHLYDAFVQVFVGDKEVECTRLRIGFYDRKIGAEYRYSGMPLKIKAARYRSFFNDEGRIMTPGDYAAELAMLKKCHFNAVCIDTIPDPEFVALCREEGVLVIESFGFDVTGAPDADKFFDTDSAADFVKEVCISRIMRDRSSPCVIGFSFGVTASKKCFETVASDISLNSRFMIYGEGRKGFVSVVPFRKGLTASDLGKDNGVILSLPGKSNGAALSACMDLFDEPNVFGCYIDEFRDITLDGKIFSENGILDGKLSPKPTAVLCKYYMRPLRSSIRDNRYLDVENVTCFDAAPYGVTVFTCSGSSETEIKRFTAEIPPRCKQTFVLPHIDADRRVKLEVCYRDENGYHVASEILFTSVYEKALPDLSAFLNKNYTYSVVPFDQTDEENAVQPHATFVPCSCMAVCDSGIPTTEKSDRVSFLNGDWFFRYLGNNTPASFSSTEGEWKVVSVPGSWEEEGVEKFSFVRGYDFRYKKQKGKYEFDKNTENTAAIYKKVVNVADLSFRYFLSFESLSGAIQVYLNGKYVGCSSYKSAEFELTKYLIVGENEIVVLMKKLSKNSFIFAKDDFAQTGILGDVALIKRHKKGLVDCDITTGLVNKVFTVSVLAAFGEDGGKVRFRLKKDGKTVAEGERDVSDRRAKFDFSDEYLPYFEEEPSLYDLYVSVLDKDNVVECTKLKVGLSALKKENCVTYNNDVPLKIRGVIYNPVYTENKKMPTVADYAKDIDLIKSYGFNALQPTFVPTADFLSLCRDKGMYVFCRIPVDERYRYNDDKHKKGVWFDEDFIRRVKKQTEKEYARTKLFNNVFGYVFIQSPSYPAISAAAELLREKGGRIVLASGQIGDYCGLRFPTVMQTMDKVGLAMGKSALVLTEYAPSYGVGCADLFAYEDIVSDSPCCLGGFMCQFVDEIIGDQGYRDNGLFSAERIPSAGAENVKYLYRKVRSRLIDNARLELTNLRDYKDTSDLLVKLCVLRDGRLLSRTDLVATVPARSAREFDLFIDHVAGDMYLNVEYYDKKSGKLLLTEQHTLSEKMITVLPKDSGKLRIDEFPDYLDIRFDGGTMRFDKKLGAFTRYSVLGKEVLKPERLEVGGNCFIGNIERPFVRNMLSEDRPQWVRVLRDFSWSRSADGSYVDILVETSVNKKNKECFVIRDKYIVSGNGRVEVFSVINPMRRNLPDLDCFGKQLRLHNAFGNISYYGMGGCSNYVDMCGCARMGAFNFSVDKVFDGVYLKQECGNRMNVHYVVARDKDGDGIMCVAEQAPFQLRVSPYSDNEIERAFRGENVAQSGVYIDVNAFVSGYGSNRGEPAKKFTYLPVEYVLHFSVLPVAKSDK